MAAGWAVADCVCPQKKLTGGSCTQLHRKRAGQVKKNLGLGSILMLKDTFIS